MIDIASLAHFFTIGGVVALNSLAVGWGQGLVGKQAMQALDEQPHAANQIKNITLFGTVLIEASAIFALLFVVFMGIGDSEGIKQFYGAIGELGTLFSLGITGAVAALAAAEPAKAACDAVARQPFEYPKILRLMFISQSIIQTSVIFALVLCFFIIDQTQHAQTFEHALKLISAGLALGLGSIGPTIGLGKFAAASCASIGNNPKAFEYIFSFSLLSNAIIEAPTIFSFVIAVIILFFGSNDIFINAFGLLGAALSIGIGTFGPGIGSGRVATAAVDQIAHNLPAYPQLSKTSLLCQGLIDTCAIYALVISIFLIFI